jgi:PTS system ascorbate-specific IIA component
MTTLTSLLTDDRDGDAATARIALDVAATDWRDAVTAAGRLLEDTGATDPAYTDAMITSVEDNGPYIVVSPGFAFAHARPSEAVHRTAMSWLRLAEPVAFGHPTNDPVTLVVALAATDASAHTTAMSRLARVVGKKSTRRALDEATDGAEILRILDGASTPASPAPAAAPVSPAAAASYPGGNTRDHILTVCGNGVGTSLFLKNTVEQVLDRWGWGPFVTVEATDTISAKGKAGEADVMMTSGSIADTLGDPGIPVWVVNDFTDETEIDAALRQIYDL